MSIAKAAARFTLHQMGGLRFMRRRNSGLLRILMYHRFSAPHPDLQGALDRQLAAFRRHYRILSLTEIADILERKQPFPPQALTITIDDGYRDFFEVAYPVLKAQGLPATMYLVSGFLDRKLWLWTDQVSYLCERTRVREAVLQVGSQPPALSFATPEQRRAAARELIELLKKQPNAIRLEVLARLPEQLAVDLPAQPPADLAPLSWDEVRSMAKHGIEFGAHTETHPILSRIADKQEMWSELATSQRRIAEELGSKVAHFCYPNGHAQDYNEAVVHSVEELGFRTAVTTTPGMNRAGENRLLLKRFGMEPESPLPYALERVEGLHD